MKTEVDSHGSGGVDGLPSSVVFDVLAHPRRRYALQYLSQKVGAVHVGDLAEGIALWEGELTRDRYERVCTALVHIHLPKLGDAGIVRYQSESERIELQPVATQLTPYLQLAATDDLQ